jgi:hypothetical protein
MATGLMWNDQVVELSGVPEPDEATLNPFGLIGYELVAVTTVAATWYSTSSRERSVKGVGRFWPGTARTILRCPSRPNNPIAYFRGRNIRTHAPTIAVRVNSYLIPP